MFVVAVVWTLRFLSGKSKRVVSVTVESNYKKPETG